MNPLPGYLRQYGAETEPSPEDCRQLYLAVRAQRTDAEVALNLLGMLSVESRGAAAPRLVVRAVTRRPRLRRRRVAIAGTLAAASLLLAIGLLFTAPQPPPRVVVLKSENHWTTARPSPGVQLELKGEGDVTGSAKRPRVNWSTGELRVEVDPDAGIDLVVETREARTRVVGTVFSVDRDLLGTHVVVTRGKVETTCQRGGETVLLGAGAIHTCLPTNAVGMLARARFQQDHGAAWSAVLATVDGALAGGDGTAATKSELRVIRIQALLGLGRRDDALSAAHDYLAAGIRLRRDEVAALAATLEQEEQ